MRTFVRRRYTNKTALCDVYRFTMEPYVRSGWRRKGGKNRRERSAGQFLPLFSVKLRILFLLKEMNNAKTSLKAFKTDWLKYLIHFACYLVPYLKTTLIPLNQMIITTRYLSFPDRKKEIGNFGILITVLQVEGISRVENKSTKTPDCKVSYILKYSKFC